MSLIPNPTRALRGSSPALACIRARSSGLRAAEAKVAAVILNNPEFIASASVGDVAGLAGTSQASVVRCAQSVGFRGFHALKSAIADEMLYVPQARAAREASVLVADLIEAGAQRIRDAATLIPIDTFEHVSDLLAGAEHVVFAGVGSSAPICHDAAYRFSAIGVRASWHADAHHQALACRQLSGSDVCVAVSHSGAAKETLAAARTARAAGASVIALTSFARSPLTELTNDVLLGGAHELGPGGLQGLLSRVASAALLDALIVAVSVRTPERSARSLEAYADVLAAHRL